MLRVWLRLDPRTIGRLATVGLVVGSGVRAFDRQAAATLADYTSSDTGTEWVKPGEWAGITLKPASFENRNGVIDWAHVRDVEFTVSDRGRGGTNVDFGGFDVLPATSSPPLGLVSFTFDDGFRGVVNNARPALAEHGFVGTAYIIRDLITPGESGTYMSPTDLHALQDSGWEIAAHADRLAVHNAHDGLLSLPLREVRRDWENERRYLHAGGFNGQRDFAYPQGYFDLSILAMARQHWVAAASTFGRSIETVPPADRYRLRRTFCYPGSRVGPPTSPGTIEWLVEQTSRYGGWLILGFHDIVSEGPTSESDAVNVTLLRQIAHYVASRNLTVKTVGQVLDHQHTG
jgi:peptidoglycan/xylan/chitin deacetylase (PgdA/CDA1 family)